MVFDPSSFPRVLTIQLELSNFPILASRIRQRMRQELFKRKVISPQAFETEVRQKAIQSQRREGILDPFTEEPPDVWANRQAIVRDNLTDFYFAYNLPHDLFEMLLRDVLAKRMPSEDVVLTYHPELAPWDMLFAQGASYENLPEDQLPPVKHHLQEIKVVLIKAMISDHLEYVGIAKEWFDIADLSAIRSRRFGRGRIGGKAAGVMLADCVLRKTCTQELLPRIRIPRSWFLGADVFYQYTHINDFLDFSNQKYRDEAMIRRDYPSIRERFQLGVFPDEVLEGLRTILQEVGSNPLIVRSSSLLEDSFGTSFAGKYESSFCPNQGTPEENLDDLVQAINGVYASVYSPEAILYRRRMRLIDYDERMAILIQEVKGRKSGRYFRPDGAGVAFSRNQFRWNERIDRDAGFMRLVWGLGTRAVDQVGGDYARLVPLSHPGLRPEVKPQRIRRYSQQFVDVIDLQENSVKSLPIAEVLSSNTPYLRFLSQRYMDDHIQDMVNIPLRLDSRELVLTFNGLLTQTDFPQTLQYMLHVLEAAYERPVDTEFVVEFQEDEQGNVKPLIHLLQCRPQSHLLDQTVELPRNVPEKDRIFTIRGLVPDGKVSDIRYAIMVGEPYQQLPETDKKKLAQVIGRLNEKLKGENFILLGPGRWGSVNPELGIPVAYSEIYNARALVEVMGDESAIEPSYGTHFFQDLVEADIYILALSLSAQGAEFDRSFFQASQNHLAAILPKDQAWEEVLKVVDIQAQAEGRLMELIMVGDEGTALAYLKKAKR